ncbi:MAG: type II toxin-antitoxin system VapC family toxin [Acidimicrobiales bacterium]
MSVWYLDSSAIVKFAVTEPESRAIAAWRERLDSDDVLMTCELAITEVLRAVRRVDGDAEVALAHLDALDQLVIDRDLLLAAGQLGPSGLRTLDAIHLAAATAAGDDLRGVVTYDDRMADAARELGLGTLAPGRAEDTS